MTTWRGLGVFILTLTACATHDISKREPASTKFRLEHVFPGLPRVLREDFGSADVEFKNSHKVSISYAAFRTRSLPAPNGKGAPILISSGNKAGKFNISAPFHGDRPVIDEELAKTFMQYFYARLYPWHSKVDLGRKLQDRVVRYGSFKLLGDTPPEDKVAALWWKLRLEGATRQPGPLREGDRVIVAIRTFGYKGSSFTPADFGHSTMGVRTIGGNPDNDYILNPGAKTDEGFRATVWDAIRGSPKVPNKLSTLNLWDWMQSQRDDRFLDIDVRILPISDEQAQALDFVRREFKEVEWGPFLMLSNNCANGAWDLYNSLLPINSELDVKAFGSIVIPENVLNAAAERFGEVHGFVLTSPPPPEGTDTPDVPAKVIHERRTASMFRAYLEAENDVLGR